MTHTLLVYERPSGRILAEEAFDLRAEALAARFKAEREYRGREDEIEVVVLGSHSRADLLKTHARYFLSLGQLADRLA